MWGGGGGGGGMEGLPILNHSADYTFSGPLRSLGFYSEALILMKEQPATYHFWFYGNS